MMIRSMCLSLSSAVPVPVSEDCDRCIARSHSQGIAKLSKPFILIFILSFQKRIDLSISMTFLKEFTVSTFHC